MPSSESRKLEHDFLTAPIVTLYHVRALIIGGCTRLAPTCRGSTVHFTVSIGGPGSAEAHAHSLIAPLGQAGPTPSLSELGVVVADGCVLVETGSEQVFTGTWGSWRHQVLQVLVAVTGWEGRPLVFQFQREREATIETRGIWHHCRADMTVRRGWQRTLQCFGVWVFPMLLPGVSWGPDRSSAWVYQFLA